MGYELMSELELNKLMDLGGAKRASYVKLLVPMFEAVLREHGPLPDEGLLFFVNDANDLHLTWQDAVTVMNSSAGQLAIESSWLGEGEGYQRFFALQGQFAAGVQPELPAPQDYVGGYYRLLRLLHMAQTDPTVLQAPAAFLQALKLL